MYFFGTYLLIMIFCASNPQVFFKITMFNMTPQCRTVPNAMRGSKCQGDTRNAIAEFMRDRGLWKDNLASEIPSTVENYGGLIVLNSSSFSNPQWRAAGNDLWNLVCSLYKGNRIAMKGRIKDNDYRTPQTELIFGTSPLASFVDNGIKYQWNVEKTMFSRGNVPERHRIARLDCSNEVVVDLYAGIGYFTVPYLVHAKARHVHACEWNPDAVESLKINLSANNVAERCTIYEGDNRLVCPKKVAHRVNLGLLPSSEKSWGTACEALLPTGGLLYVHQNVRSNVPTADLSPICPACCRLKSDARPVLAGEVTLPVKIVSKLDVLRVDDERDGRTVKWKRAEWLDFSLHLSHQLLACLETYHGGRWSVSVTGVFKVKSYAPHVDHLVFSVECQPSAAIS